LKQANEMKVDKSPNSVTAMAANLSCLLQMKDRGMMLCLAKGEHRHPNSGPNCSTRQPGLQHLQKLVLNVVHAASPW
jgi:hypothetical protein